MCELDVVIEIPRGSRNKYEYDHETHKIRFSRMLSTSMVYACDYGFFPDTLAPDKDPLDALVLVEEPTFPGCIIKVRPVGMLNMIDQGLEDNKVLCVPVTDPHWNHIKKLSQVPKGHLNEIEHFFKVYKQLENKVVVVNGYAEKRKAEDYILKCQEAFENVKEKDLYHNFGM